VLDEVLFDGKIGVLLRHGSFNSIGRLRPANLARFRSPCQRRTTRVCTSLIAVVDDRS
jgi:hypothetical protein